MQFIQGSNRNQTYFATLNGQVAADNAVRLMDAFVDKLDLQQLGFTKTMHKSEGRPPFAPAVLLKLYLYGYLNKIRSSRKLEKECTRNIELQWLLQNLQPNYHTIADFRKLHAVPLQSMFRLYVHFLGDSGLLGNKTIAIDGSKFKAVNSKKNNYNQKKIDKHRQFIEDKTNKYLQELDEIDQQESTTAGDELQLKKEKITQGLIKLKERSIKYDLIQEQLNNTDDKQISTTDCDSRSILITKSIVEVAYNTQNAVDDKHNLIVHTQATNTNDGKALHNTAMQAKINLQLQKEDELMILADKGYHTGAELQQCQQENMITHVAYKEQPSVKHIANEFLAESFHYDKVTDIYVCPAGATLTSLGTWHHKKGEANETSYRFKTYRTDARKTCPLKNQCTKLPKRIIQRSEYQDAVDINDTNIKKNPAYYKRRQAIAEHPFGTIKRHFGYTHTLLKGLQKVNGEMNLIMFCYNFMRTKNILGFEKMLEQIQKWQPNYNKVVCAIQKAIIKVVYRLIKPVVFLYDYLSLFLKAPLMKRYTFGAIPF
ncbi:IS1182 family transposase [Panacibacter microcysteis]|uniref:IS1182 family transposase n=1 Tax=Panacibacter microcysteis TaxID=2793269 RepID=UPI0018C8FC08|nr:IS1182 family transposase [Panacibacter microcysteis]